MQRLIALAADEGAELVVVRGDMRMQIAELLADRADRGGGNSDMFDFLAPVARLFRSTFNVGGRSPGPDHDLAVTAPVLAVLTTPGDDPADHQRAARALERVLSAAEAEGIQATCVNQPLPHKELQALLPGRGYPHAVIGFVIP